MSDKPLFDSAEAQLAALDLMAWARKQNEAGFGFPTLALTMFIVGLQVSVGPDDDEEHRAMWARQLRAMADDIEAGRDAAASLGHA